MIKKSGELSVATAEFKQKIPTLSVQGRRTSPLAAWDHKSCGNLWDVSHLTQVNLEVVQICDALDWTVKLLAYQMAKFLGAYLRFGGRFPPNLLGKLFGISPSWLQEIPETRKYITSVAMQGGKLEER